MKFKVGDVVQGCVEDDPKQNEIVVEVIKINNDYSFASKVITSPFNNPGDLALKDLHERFFKLKRPAIVEDLFEKLKQEVEREI